jgi:tetratricopeptide (TPR) repeat protein
MTEPQLAELPMQFRPVHRERPQVALPSVPELPPDEPPPPSPEEQKLREFLSDPRNWRKLLTYAEMFPERYERLMAMIARHYPRAFPEGDILFQREWYANRQRRINEQLTMYQIQYQRVWDRYQAEISELQEKWETFTQSINNAVTPQDVIGVLYETAGAGLPPDKYQLLTRMGKAKLLAILSQLPTPEMQKTLDILGRRGFFSPQELETFQGYLRGEHWARRSLASVAQMDVARLRSAIERAKNLRVNVAPLETQLKQLERLTTMMEDMPTNPELLNVISRQTTQITTELERLVREALRPIETSLQRLASFIYAQFGNRDQLRSWFRDAMRTLPQVLGRFSPQLTQALLQGMGDIEKANDKAVADGLLMLADALTETIERLKTDFGDFPQVAALVSMVEPLVGELRRKAQDLHTLAQTLERVYDQVGEALAKDPLRGMSEAQWRRLAMQERGLQLREWGLRLQAERNEIAKARLRLAEQMFDWRQQQANIGRALQTLGLMVRVHTIRGDYDNALRAAGTLANILSDLGNLDKLENLGLLSPELAGAVKVLRQVSEIQLNTLLSELQNAQQKSRKGTKVSPDPILQRVDELLNTLLLSLGVPSLLAPEGQPTSSPPPPSPGQGQVMRQGRQLPTPVGRPAAPRPSPSPPPARPSYRDVLGGGLFTP